MFLNRIFGTIKIIENKKLVHPFLWTYCRNLWIFIDRGMFRFKEMSLRGLKSRNKLQDWCQMEILILGWVLPAVHTRPKIFEGFCCDSRSISNHPRHVIILVVIVVLVAYVRFLVTLYFASIFEQLFATLYLKKLFKKKLGD